MWIVLFTVCKFLMAGNGIVTVFANSNNVYLFFYRSVFDVTKGKSHYGPGGGYHHFAGRYVLKPSFLLHPCFCSVCISNPLKYIHLNSCFSWLGYHDFRDASRAFFSGNFTGKIVEFHFNWMKFYSVFHYSSFWELIACMMF